MSISRLVLYAPLLVAMLIIVVSFRTPPGSLAWGPWIGVVAAVGGVVMSGYGALLIVGGVVGSQGRRVKLTAGLMGVGHLIMGVGVFLTWWLGRVPPF